MLGGGGGDPRVLKALGGERDQALHVPFRFLRPAGVGFPNVAIALPGLRKPVERHADPDESAMCLFAPPIGLDPSPCFVDRIQELQSSMGLPPPVDTRPLERAEIAGPKALGEQAPRGGTLIEVGRILPTGIPTFDTRPNLPKNLFNSFTWPKERS